MKSLAFRVHGRVQGVNYRAGVLRLAERYGVDGWVRNVSDGTVQGRVAGPDEAVDAFVAALPDAAALARVERVETRAVVDEIDAGSVIGFEVWPNAEAPTSDWR